MKVVYVGPMYDGTGYSHAARNTAEALDAQGVDITVRNIKLCGQVIPPSKRIQELERKSVEGATHVIQHYLPHAMVYRGGFKNIGYYHSETTNFRPSLWQHYLNMMDELLVCSEQNAEAAKASGITKPVKVVPIPCDPTTYSKQYNPLPLGIGNRFAFYHIGDWSERKNLPGLIRAYFQAFTRRDNVVLVIKSYREGKSPADSQKFIQEQITNIKKNMRLYGIDVYPPVIIIPGYISEEEIYGLHQQCHCFVSLERGAAWNIPGFDAMAFNKPVILNGWGGQTQFAASEDVICKPEMYGVKLLPYKMVKVFGMDHVPYNGVYSSHEEWADPDLDAAASAMRTIYETWVAKKLPTLDRSQWLDQWSFQGTAGIKLARTLKE